MRQIRVGAEFWAPALKPRLARGQYAAHAFRLGRLLRPTLTTLATTGHRTACVCVAIPAVQLCAASGITATATTTLAITTPALAASTTLAITTPAVAAAALSTATTAVSTAATAVAPSAIVADASCSGASKQERSELDQHPSPWIQNRRSGRE